MTFGNVISGLDWSYLLDMAVSVIPALICITLHELSHGYTAYRLGDDTAKTAGRLTLNPIKHIDVFGLIMMVAFKFGWAKPVPVNMFKMRHPKRDMAITALAGPVSNLLIGCVFLFLYGLFFLPLGSSGGAVSAAVLKMLYITAYLSFALAIFNIIPIPPLDGSKVLFSVLDYRSYLKLMKYERYGMILLLALVATNLLGSPLTTATGFVYNKFAFMFKAGLELGLKVFG